MLMNVQQHASALVVLWLGVVLADEAKDALARSKFALARNRMLCTKAQSNIDFKEVMASI